MRSIQSLLLTSGIYCGMGVLSLMGCAVTTPSNEGVSSEPVSAAAISQQSSERTLTAPLSKTLEAAASNFSDNEETNIRIEEPPSKFKNIALIDPVTDGETNVTRRASFDEAMESAQERQKVFADGAPQSFTLKGVFSQGGLLFGQTQSGAKVRLNGKVVKVDEAGRFVLGFGRDSDLTALLLVTQANGSVERHTIELADKEFKEERIDGLDQSKVSGYTKEQLAKIGVDRKLKDAARSKTQDGADFVDGFEWPLTGRISGEFGSRRILNGEPKRPHSGVDIARPTGTPIRAPAAGVITLAKSGMYFEGGLVLLDHGHWLESAFLHMSRIDVVPGQRVAKGEVIGAVGATGRVTGPHLHWSMRWTNRLVDPQLVVSDMPVGK